MSRQAGSQAGRGGIEEKKKENLLRGNGATVRDFNRNEKAFFSLK